MIQCLRECATRPATATRVGRRVPAAVGALFADPRRGRRGPHAGSGEASSTRRRPSSSAAPTLGPAATVGQPWAARRSRLGPVTWPPWLVVLTQAAALVLGLALLYLLIGLLRRAVLALRRTRQTASPARGRHRCPSCCPRCPRSWPGVGRPGSPGLPLDRRQPPQCHRGVLDRPRRRPPPPDWPATTVRPPPSTSPGSCSPGMSTQTRCASCPSASGRPASPATRSVKPNEAPPALHCSACTPTSRRRDDQATAGAARPGAGRRYAGGAALARSP